MSYLFKFGNKLMGVRRQKQESWDPDYQEQINEELPPWDDDNETENGDGDENNNDSGIYVIVPEKNEEDAKEQSQHFGMNKTLHNDNGLGIFLNCVGFIAGRILLGNALQERTPFFLQSMYNLFFISWDKHLMYCS
jgi:hypothetical protein